MRALGILTPFYPPHLGGMERALCRIATGLARVGVAVTVHTSAIGAYAGGQRRHSSSGVQVLRYGESLDTWSHAARGWASTASVDALLVSSFGPDTRDEMANALEIARKRGVRTVWRSPTADHAHRNLSGPNASVADLVDAVIANSEASAGLTARVIGRSVGVIPNLLLNDELASAAHDAPQDRACDIAWVGRVAARKRPKDLLESFRILREAGLTVHVQATGSYGEPDLLQQFLHHLPDGVVLHTPSAVQPAEVRRATVFLHLSEVEGSPNSVLEAAARGSIPITSDIPECRELLAGTRSRHLASNLDGILDTARDALTSSTRSSRIAQHQHFALRHAEAAVIPQWVVALFE